MSIRGRKSLCAAAVAALSCSLVLAGPTVASADPASQLAQAKAAAASADQAVTAARTELDRLDDELGAVEEEYAQAKLEQQASEQRANALRTDIAAEQAKVDALHKQAADFARASFQNAGVDTTTKLFVSGDPESFLQQVSTAAKVDENMNSVLQQYQAEQGNLADLKRAADAEVAKSAEAAAKMADLEAKGKKNVEDAQALVDKLSDEQREAVEAVSSAQQAVDAAAAPATTAKAATSSAAVATGSSGGAPSSAAAQALAYARAHIGSSYVWAAEGPNAFDCSGLMVASYRSAGISIPHSSLTLSTMYTPVSRDNLRPGDLIFWYSPVHHVAMYEGNGMMVHAQNSTVGVVETPVDQWIGWGIYYAGARRVVG